MMFFYIGLAMCVFGLGYTSYRTMKTNNLISPQMILTFGLFVYLYLPALIMNSEHINDEGYNLILLIGVLGAILASGKFPYDVISTKKYETRRPKIIYFQVASYLFTAILLIQILQSIISAGGILSAFRVNRLESYLNGDMISDSLVMELFKEGLKICFYIYIAYLIENRKTLKAIMLFSIPMIHHRFTAVTRYDFIAMAATLILYFVYRRLAVKNIVFFKEFELTDSGKKKRYKIKPVKVFILGFVGLYLALIFMRVANFTRFGESASGINISFSVLLKNTLSNDSLYYEYFYTLFKTLKSGRIGYEYGMSWFVYPLINFVPRFLWPGKPYTAFSARMTDKIFWSLTSGNPVVTFTMLGEGYVQLGLLGVFVCSYIFLYSRWINFRMLKKIKFNEMYTLLLLFSLVTYMRSEAPIFYMLLDAFWLWIITIFFTERCN